MHMLRKIGLSFAALSVVAMPMAAQAETQKEKAASKLAKLLEGREAGEPRNCLFLPSITDRLRVLEGTALVFGSGNTIYVNYTDDPDSIDRNDTIVFRRYGSQLCDTDVTTTVDRISGTYTGNMRLTQFIPYTKK